MQSNFVEFVRPRFRSDVQVKLSSSEAALSLGGRECSFQFPSGAQAAVSQLLEDLKDGKFTVPELKDRSAEIADQVPDLLSDLSNLRLLTESNLDLRPRCISGAQLYRELRRVAARVTANFAKSAFYRALIEGNASARQLIGYGLEYYWLVRNAPGIIAPALASAHGIEERRLLEAFLSSEIGHDRYIGGALQAVGMSADDIEQHQPLPETFAVGASLGVYARQHPASFKACLFILEETRPNFIEAFDRRCDELGLPAEFYSPLREHADLNADYDHGDISRDLLALEQAIDDETCTVVKRHVALMIEMIVLQEEKILAYYEEVENRMPRLFS